MIQVIKLTGLLLASKGTRAATLDAIIGGVARFVERPADEIRKSPFYPIYLFTLHATARKPTAELVALLVAYNKSSVRGTNIAAAIKELRMIIISKWFLFCPYRFHDIVDILHGAQSKSDAETKRVCRALLDDFILHLETSTETTILKDPVIINQIREIKENGFKHDAVTEYGIRGFGKERRKTRRLSDRCHLRPCVPLENRQRDEHGRAFCRSAMEKTKSGMLGYGTRAK